MGLFAPVENTKITILGGNTYNAAGDKISGTTVIQSGLSVCLVETSKTIYDPATQMPRTIRSSTLYLPSGTSITTDNRVTDESTGHTYMVIGILQAPTFLPFNAPVVCDLKRVTGKTV